MLESVIQTKIITRLEKAGWYVIKLIQTNKNGIHDLLCLKDGQPVFIEVKGRDGKQTELQKYREKELQKYGIKTMLINSEHNIEKLITCK